MDKFFAACKNGNVVITGSVVGESVLTICKTDGKEHTIRVANGVKRDLSSRFTGNELMKCKQLRSLLLDGTLILV